MPSIISTAANALKAGYIPQVVFGTQGAHSKEVVAQFLDEFERSICDHFDCVEVNRPAILSTAMVLLLRTDSVRLVLIRSKAECVDWQLIVCPGLPLILGWLSGRRMSSERVNLRKTCREIHAMLTGLSGVSCIYWYARRSALPWSPRRWIRKDTPGVWTPEELPWTE